MSATEPTSARLESLRARWQADTGSRVFLQLADEYRRLGRNADAAGVLEEGLRANPTHPAARVALGRCRLELGQTAEAIRELETVLESDPTQMVAYRLLVEAYLREGRAELARQRLRVYSLLNDSDPEIADLRRRIGEIDRQEGEHQAAVAPPPPQPTITTPAGTGEPPEEPEGMSEPPQPSSPEAAEPARAASPTRAESEPFPALAAGEVDRRRYLSGLAAGGVFELPPRPEAPAAAEPAAAPIEAPIEEPIEEPVAERPAAAPVPKPETTPEEVPSAPVQVFELGEPATAPPSDLSSLLDREASPVGREPAALDEEPAALGREPAAAPEEPQGRATVTLGRLYLRQGHLGEAEAIFREVLALDPGDAEARRGLAEVAASERPELRAAELLGDHGAGARGEGLTDRKRHMLERYLQRLRGGAAGNVR